MQRFWVLKGELNMDLKNEKNYSNCLLRPPWIMEWAWEAATPVPHNGALIRWSDQVEGEELVDMVRPAFEQPEELKKKHFNGVGATPAQWGVSHPI